MELPQRQRPYHNPKRERGTENPKKSLAYGLVALIPTRRVSEGFCEIVGPSLTLRVVMFPLPAAKLLNQQAVTLRVRINAERTITFRMGTISSLDHIHMLAIL
jgi:hypothetical protein